MGKTIWACGSEREKGYDDIIQFVYFSSTDICVTWQGKALFVLPVLLKLIVRFDWNKRVYSAHSLQLPVAFGNSLKKNIQKVSVSLFKWK